MGEAAGLLSGTVDEEGLVFEGAFDEVGYDHAVLSGLAGADGVEEPGDGDGQLKLLMVSEAQVFLDGFAAGVGPSWDGGAAENGIVVFLER